MDAIPPAARETHAERPITLRVIGNRTVNRYVEYCIELQTADGDTWQVHRRFREVFELHSLLFLSFRDRLPRLPTRRVFGLGKLLFGSQDQEFVEERQADLQRYLEGVITMDPLVTTPLLRKFLGFPHLDKSLSLGPELGDVPMSVPGQWHALAAFDLRLVRTMFSKRQDVQGRAVLSSIPLSVIELLDIVVRTSRAAGATDACQLRAVSRVVAENLRQVVPRLFAETSSIYVSSNWNRERDTALAQFNPRTLEWEEVPGCPNAEFAMASVGSHLYLLWTDPRAVHAEFFQQWDAVNRRWSTLPQRPGVIRSRFSIAAAGGAVYSFGGFAGRQCLGITQRFLVSQGRWELLPDMPMPRADSAAASLHGRLFVLGGTYHNGEPCSAAECLLPNVNKWTTLPQMRLPRHSMAATGACESIFVFGGNLTTRGHILADAVSTPAPERLDLTSGVWETVRAPEQLERPGIGVATVAGSLFVFGGGFTGGFIDSSNIDRLNTETLEWDALELPRFLHGQCVATTAAS